MSEAVTFPLLPRRRVGGLVFGAMRSRSRGLGTDLAGARPYRPGDDVRRIDWRASARLSLARGGDEFVVREHLTEEATHVVVMIDRSPTMELYPPELPWLCKPAAIREAGAMIVESALRAACSVGFLDDALTDDEGGNGRAAVAPWAGAGARTEHWRIREEERPRPSSAAPRASLEALLARLVREERPPPSGTFVFLLSDFLDFGGGDVWQEALDLGLDLVPVIIQDPDWEQSFPEVVGSVLPLADPASGQLVDVYMSRAEVRSRREENGERLRSILRRLEGLGLDWALVSSHDRGRVLKSFVDWATVRHHGARLA